MNDKQAMEDFLSLKGVRPGTLFRTGNLVVVDGEQRPELSCTTLMYINTYSTQNFLWVHVFLFGGKRIYFRVTRIDQDHVGLMETVLRPVNT